MDKPLSENHTRFIDELFAEGQKFNATRAYEIVYKAEGHYANTAAAQLMQRDDIKAEIAKRQAALREQSELTARDILTELFLVATADPRDLVEFYRGACRHCYGTEHKYQRTPQEFDNDLQHYLKENKAFAKKGLCDLDEMGVFFDVKGGMGFTPRRAPVIECPECFGEGVGYTYVKDTRTLSKGAARLYAGVKQTRDGIEMKMRSADKALELAGQHLGLFKTGLQISGPGGGPVESTVTVLPVDPIEAAKIYQALISK